MHRDAPDVTRLGALQRLAREPLLHFILLGAAIVAVGRLSPEADPAPRERDAIVVTQGTLDQMIERFTYTRIRPPTPEELRGLVDAYVREEALYREALALGFDRDDTIIRRRLAQKMQFITEGLTETADPSDEELEELRRSEPERFTEPARISFEHVFVNVERRGESARADAEAILRRLNDPNDPADSRTPPRRIRCAASRTAGRPPPDDPPASDPLLAASD